MASPSDTAGSRATFNQVLREELGALRPSALAGFEAAGFDADGPMRSSNLAELYRRVGHLEDDAAARNPEDRAALSALCLSGGGIRSATFNLGVIQGLARLGLLGHFDYLSSVSGGGYIAGWLRAWMRRDGVASVVDALGSRRPPANPLAPEPEPIDRLREYSNYLTPKVGLLSADTWTAAAIVVRNLLLNWLVILPLLGVLVSIPQCILLVVQSSGFQPQTGRALLDAALAVALAGSVAVYWCRRWIKKPETPQSLFVLACVVPIYLAATLLSTAALGLEAWREPGCKSVAQVAALWEFALLWCVAIPVAGWLPSEARLIVARDGSRMGAKVASPLFELLALVASGVIAAALLVAMVRFWLPALYARPALYTILAFPSLLGLYLLARALFVAFASLSESWTGELRRGASDDADREWWARLSGWVLLGGVGWLGVSTLCVLGGHLLRQLEAYHVVHMLAGAGGMTGLVGALLGSAGEHRDGGGSPSRLRALAGAATAPIFALCVVLVVAHATALLGELATSQPAMLKLPLDLARDPNAVSAAGAVPFLWVPLGLAVIAVAMGRVVNVNRFSLHGVYRNRLVRAYLGASNSGRRPDPFTGFAVEDNLKLHELWKAPEAARPLPLLSATLNLVKSGDKLAWQQRKAESFSMTPFFCGNFHEGYRRSSEYGGALGISLGSAVSISGAAASPNQGYHSSPVMGFLMALFNLRLGAWMGNTNEHGEHTYRLPGPRQALFPLLAELFGLTTAKGRYVNLTDGGHFDNSGLYEVVLRRCRYVLVSDCGQDPGFGFADLGNAIRKIRIDFGIPIVFQKPIAILPRSAQGPGAYCATAVIRYSEADGASAPDGQLVYLKPTLRGGGEPVPYDVYGYAQEQLAFPHESTVDQWFSESQFESYRALGLHALLQLGGAAPAAGVKDLFARLPS